MKKNIIGALFAAFAGICCCFAAETQTELLYQPDKPGLFKKDREYAPLRRGKLDVSKPFTLLCMFRMQPDAPYRQFKDLISFGGERGPGFRITLFYGGIGFRSGDGNKVSAMSAPGTIRILPGWNHLAAVYDGETGRLILNGKEVKKAPLKISPFNGSTLHIGNFPYGTGYPFCGEISYLRIVPGVLDDEHLVQDYMDHNLK